MATSINVGINESEKAVLSILISNPEKTVDEMATEVNVSKQTIERVLVTFKEKEINRTNWVTNWVT